MLRAPIVGDARGGSEVEVGAGLFMVPGHGAVQPGFAVLPYASGTTAISLNLTDTTTFAVDAGFDLAGGVGLVITPGAVPQLLIGLIAASGAGLTSTHLALSLTSTANSPVLLLGSSDGSHLQIGGVSLTAGPG